MTNLERQDLIYDQIRGILGEHFHNFCFVVMDEDGELFYDYTNYRIGKMLMTEALDDLDSDFGGDDFEWPDDGDDDDDEYEELI
jgi:hypothetical protein